MSHDPFNRPLGTAPGEAYGPQEKPAAGETWAASIAAVLCFVGFVAYLFFYR